ncbi:hypothetical protein M404DRAFT_165642, partial [Pisolithus tinctorius Marx 270]
LVYLPLYSPDLNPIEECFSYLKAYICHHGNQFHAVIESGDKMLPYLFLYGRLDTVTPEAAHGWFHNAGYL